MISFHLYELASADRSHNERIRGCTGACRNRCGNNCHKFKIIGKLLFTLSDLLYHSACLCLVLLALAGHLVLYYRDKAEIIRLIRIRTTNTVPIPIRVFNAAFSIFSPSVYTLSADASVSSGCSVS